MNNYVQPHAFRGFSLPTSGENQLLSLSKGKRRETLNRFNGFSQSGRTGQEAKSIIEMDAGELSAYLKG